MMKRILLAAALAACSLSSARAQDVASGEKTFAQCRACHQVGEAARNTVGPVLNGVIGRQAGTLDGYSYSAAMKGSGLAWDETTFADYIRDPKVKVPGTKMIYAGQKDAARVADLIAYLKQFGGDGKKAP